MPVEQFEILVGHLLNCHSAGRVPVSIAPIAGYVTPLDVGGVQVHHSLGRRRIGKREILQIELYRNCVRIDAILLHDD